MTWLILLLGVSACTPYYLVTSEYVANRQMTSEPEVTETRSYNNLRRSLSTIAIRAPDSCADKSTTAHTGEAAGKGLLLKTDCGVEMAELERALSKKDFNVISWDVIKNRVSKSGNITSEQAAADLGAQVLFQINSLERSSISLAQNARWDRRFFKSNSSGMNKGPAKVNKKMKNVFDSYIEPMEKDILPEKQLSATINATATLIGTGQSIWFYEWTLAEPLEANYRTQILLACDGDRCKRIGQQKRKTLDEVFSGSTKAVSVTKRDANRINAKYNQLIEDLLDDLVSRFAKN